MLSPHVRQGGKRAADTGKSERESEIGNISDASLHSMDGFSFVQVTLTPAK